MSIDKQNRTQEDQIPYFQKLDKWGLTYIKKELHILFISGIYPFFLIFVQLYNIFQLVRRFELRPPPIPNNQPRFIDLLTPFILLLMFAILASIYFLYLILWFRKISEYQRMISNGQENTKDTFKQKRYSLTQLFYDIIRFMQSAKIIFVLMNILFIFNAQWLIRFILLQLNAIPSIHPQPNLTLQILNTIGQLGLIPYMIFEWMHFLRWNQKLKKVTEFERKIYEEIELNGEI